MAGRPMLRRICDMIDENGGPEWICDHIADGATSQEVADLMGCSRRYIYAIRDAPRWDGRFKTMWAEAQRLSADAQIEKAMADFERLDRVIDRDPVTGDEVRRIPQASEVQLATGRAKFRQWLAARKNPEKYGDQQPQMKIQVSVGTLHLDALQAVRARESALPPAVPETITAEVVTVGG